MTVETRRWLVGLIVAALLGIGVNAIIGHAATPDIAAKVWANSLTAQGRVDAARQFYLLPADFRRALLQVQTGAEKSAMARAQITAFVAAKSDLTAEQQAVMQELYELLTPEFCAVAHRTDDTGLGRRIVALFPQEEALLFVAPGGHGVIGPQKLNSYSALPLSVQVRLFLGRHVTPTLHARRDEFDCDCDVSQGTTICTELGSGAYCSELKFCTGPSGFGCGIFHLFGCNNKCVQQRIE